MNITKAQLMVGCAFLLACIALAQDALAQTTTPATSSPATTEATAPQEPAVTTVAPAPTSPLPTPLQVRLTNLTANMSNRTDALVVRFELIMVRMDARLKKMEAEGYDTTDARFYMTEALTSLGQAKAEAATLDSKVNAFVTSENYWEQWTTLRETYTEIKNHLMRTRQLLTQALEDMKLTVQFNEKTTPEAVEVASSTPNQ